LFRIIIYVPHACGMKFAKKRMQSEIYIQTHTSIGDETQADRQTTKRRGIGFQCFSAFRL